MSNYSIKPKNPQHVVLAGWDPMLNTFFAHVAIETDEEKEPGDDLLWIGCTLNEILDVDEVVRALRPYIEEDEQALAYTLYRDAHG